MKVDADTSVPYCVVGSSPSAGGSTGRFFNLVICHDLFDNYERMKIVVSPVIARYPGAQVREEIWERTPMVGVKNLTVPLGVVCTISVVLGCVRDDLCVSTAAVELLPHVPIPLP